MMRQMRWMVLILVIAAFLFGPVSYAVEALAKGTPQEKCPVMGNPINKEQFVDYKGKRVYFCCAACPDEFKKDPEKYIKKLEEQGIALEEVKTN